MDSEAVGVEAVMVRGCPSRALASCLSSIILLPIPPTEVNFSFSLLAFTR